MIPTHLLLFLAFTPAWLQGIQLLDKSMMSDGWIKFLLIYFIGF